MTAIQMNAELFRELSIIVEDEGMMKKALRALRSITRPRVSRTRAKVAAKDIKAKADEWKAAQEDDIFEDDEIIINDVDFSEDRDYVSIKTEEAADTIKDVAEDAVDDIKND